MPRRFANQVHKQASRLLLARFTKREPSWFQAVLENPPLPLPARAPAPRSDYDLPKHEQSAARAIPPRRPRPLDPKPMQIAYVEDEIRRQFFEDHPFEAFRPRSIVEEGHVEPEHPIQGKAWTRLRQHGRNPTPEDAIKFVINLHEHHDLSLNHAYSAAVAQFRALRSERSVASHVALLEARQLGIQLGPSAVEQTFAKEEKQFETWKMTKELDIAETMARKRWRTVFEKHGGVPSSWSRGQEYVRLWQEGVRPTYSPALSTKSTITKAGLIETPAVGAPGGRAPVTEQDLAQEEQKRKVKADWMGLLR